MCAGSRERVAGARLTGPFGGQLRMRAVGPGRVCPGRSAWDAGEKKRCRGVGLSGTSFSNTGQETEKSVWGTSLVIHWLRIDLADPGGAGSLVKKLGFPQASWSKTTHRSDIITDSVMTLKRVLLKKKKSKRLFQEEHIGRKNRWGK